MTAKGDLESNRRRAGLPALAKIGFATVIAGGIGDVAAHALDPRPLDFSSSALTGGQYWGHVVMFVGMVLSVVGIVGGFYITRFKARRTREEKSNWAF
jgi:hypothetical protein